MNTIENNKLIAEFLNWEFDDLSETFETPFLILVEPHAFGDEQFSCKLHDFELKFHLDRNWLMLVVEEIKDYHDKNWYSNKDLHDISDNTSREDEINDYLYDIKYGKDKDDDFDIEYQKGFDNNGK